MALDDDGAEDGVHENRLLSHLLGAELLESGVALRASEERHEQKVARNKPVRRGRALQAHMCAGE